MVKDFGLANGECPLLRVFYFCFYYILAYFCRFVRSFHSFFVLTVVCKAWFWKSQLSVLKISKESLCTMRKLYYQKNVSSNTNLWYAIFIFGSQKL